MKEIELKPCPFCEGKAEITSYHNAVIFVQCTDCYATFPHFDSKEEAIEAWNRRAGYRKQSEGEWVVKNIFFAIYKCSICGAENLYKDGHACLSKFCSECGARRKGGAE